MPLSSIQKEVIVPLARQVVECANVPKEQADSYNLLGSALRAYSAYEYLKIFAQNDTPVLLSLIHI